MNRINPYSSFLDQVLKPARYIGGEHNILYKDWTKVRATVALCFPDVYEIGMSHLGLKILYDQLNRVDDIAAERVFCPWPDMEDEIRKRDLSLVSMESYTPLEKFMIVGFSLQHELSYTNILNMLDLGGISLWQKDRSNDDPFVIAGGPCATHPEVLVPFMDFIVIGDGEDLFVRLAYFISGCREKGIARKDILQELSLWDGIYVPSCFTTLIDDRSGFQVVGEHINDPEKKKVLRFIVPSLKEYPFPTTSPIPHLTAVFDRFSVELSRGCTEGCRFCQAGMIYRPVRERDPNDIIESVVKGIKEGGFDEASLTCLSTADYSAITPLLLDLLDRVQAEKATLGLSSLRAYGMEPEVLDKLASVQKSALTFAPEAGSQRLRQVINKNISEEDLLKTTEQVFSRGWQKMKLYFMIGLPTETDEDIEGIMQTAYNAKRVGNKFAGGKALVTASVSSFIPKPHTPFQWADMISVDEIERKQEILYQAARKYRLNFKRHYSKESVIEGILARSDRRLANVLYDVWKNGGRFDGWKDCFDYELWQKALVDNKIDTALYLGTIRLDARLPWDHIDVGLKEGFLAQEWKAAVKGRMSPPCGKPADRIVHYSNLEDLENNHDKNNKKLVCYHCGIACDLSGMIEKRKEYMVDLGALTNSPYEKPKGMGRRKNQNATKAIGGISYRLRFSKLGPICFTSHLDLQKIMMRVFKRADIEISMTHGYNPHPFISLGPALSLGVNSLDEIFDVRVKLPWDDTNKILSLLNECSERGLIFKEVTPLEKIKNSIQIAIKEMEYFIPIVEKISKEEIITKYNTLLAAKSIMVDSYVKKTKTYISKDVRDKIITLDLVTLNCSQEQSEIINEVLPEFSRFGIQLRVDAPEGRGIRPMEITKILQRFDIPVGKLIKTKTVLI